MIVKSRVIEQRCVAAMSGDKALRCVDVFGRVDQGIVTNPQGLSARVSTPSSPIKFAGQISAFSS